jgi:excisionase family DNA binding protein
MTLDESLRAAVADAVAPLDAKIARLTTAVEALKAVSPPQFLSIAEAAQRLGCCQLTVRRQVAAGAIRSRRCGRRILVDASAVRPADPAQIAELARSARTR